MLFVSTCPNCAKAGVRFSHKIAVTMDALTAARCLYCDKYSIAVPYAMSWLAFPEIIVGPMALIVWLVAGDLRFAAQVGLILYFVVFGVAAGQAPLVAFSPEDSARVERQRKWMVAGSIGFVALFLSLTLLVPVRLL